MLDVVTAAAESLTFTDLALLREDDLPSPAGAVILPRPLIIRHPSSGLLPNFAFTWQSPSRIPLPAGMGFQHAELPAVRMSDYTTTAARPNRGFLQTARAQHVALPPMLLGTAWTLPLHPDTPARHTTTSTSSPRCSGSTPPTGKTRNATAKPATTTRRLASTPQAPSWTKTRTARSAPGSCTHSGGYANSKSPPSKPPQSATAPRSPPPEPR